jgi:hypothetical protein
MKKKKDEWEEEAKDHFIVDLKAQGRGDWVVSDTDVVVDRKTNRNFDYQLKNGNDLIALEVFRLVDSKQEIERQKLWSVISNQLEAELRKREVKGFTILVPNSFSVPRNKIEKFVLKIADNLQKAIKENPNTDPIHESGFEIKRIEGFSDVSLYSIGPGGAIDPTGMAHAFLERKLPNKNRQLAIQNHERVVIIVNWLALVDKNSMIEACGRIDFSQFGNIDKVYFDIPFNKGKVHFVYDRRIYAALQPEGEIPEHIEPLFISWLTNYLFKKNLQAFQVVQKITEGEKSLLWLPNYAREQLIVYGEDFLTQDRPDDLHWIVEHLQFDPDPPLETSDGQLTDHLRIKQGAYNHLMHSVRSRLCWLLMQVVTLPRLEDYERVFEIIERFATEENLYVRQYATFALTELARRRFAHTDTGVRFMSDELAMRIKTLGLRMVEDNQEYPVVLESVANVMLFVLDLDHRVALNTVQQLLRIEDSDAADDVSSIMLYFALFRETQFKHLDPFDSKPMKDLLLDRLANGSGRFRASATNHFKNLLGLNRIQFEPLIPYLEALLGGQSNRVVNHHFYQIAAKQAAAHPDIVGCLIEEAVLGELKSLDSRKRKVSNPNDFSEALQEVEQAGPVWHPKEFSEALHVIQEAGPEQKECTTRIRKSIQPFKEQGLIYDVYDF